MGKKDKWDHNYEPEEPDESKVSWGLFWKMMRETDEAGEQMAEEAEERSQEKFKKSWLGKRWNLLVTKLQRTKSGRRKLFALRAVILVVGLGLCLGAAYGAVSLDRWLNPPDYKLTAAQEAEGYDRTCSGGGKTCSIDNVAYRVFTDAEYESDPACLTNDAWCLYTIPLYTDCTEIVVEASTTETDGWLAPTIETLEEHYKPTDSQFIKPGERVAIGLVAHSDKSQFLVVDAVYCYGSG